MNPKALAAAALALFFFMRGKAEAKPLEKPPEKKEKWQIALSLIPAIPDDGTGDAEDAIRNGVSSVFAQANGVVRSYRVSDARNVVTVLVEYQGTPKIAVGSVFSLPGSTKATVLSAFKSGDVSTV